MTWSSSDILMGLYIAVAVMILIVLYHVLFIVVDVRKMTRRAQKVSEQVEAIMMKPLTMTDQAMEWMVNFLEEKKRKK